MLLTSALFLTRECMKTGKQHERPEVEFLLYHNFANELPLERN